MTDAVAAPPVGIRTKLFYGFGSLAYGVKDTTFKYFLLLYYNQVVGLPAQLVANALLVALLVDSVLDPIIGQASDSLRSPWGRRHPFMYLSALPAAGSFLLLWMPPHGWSNRAMFGYIVTVAVLVRTFITIYEIPSSALVPELTDNYDQRTGILAYRFLFGILGGVILYVVTMKVFLKPAPGYPVGQLNPEGWWRQAIMGSSIIAASILVSAAGTHGRIPFLRQGPARGGKTLGDTIRQMLTTLSNRSFIALTAFGIINFTGAGVITALDLYFGTYFWGLAPAQLALLGLSPLIAAIISLPLSPRLSRRFGKKHAAIALLVLNLVLVLSPFSLRFAGLFPENGSKELPLVLLLIASSYWTCAIVSLTLVTSMLADVVEDSAVRTGRRSEGLFFAASSLTQKAVSGLGVFVAGLLLTYVGFPQSMKPESIDPAIVNHLVLAYVPTLIFFFGLGLLCLTRYKISRETHAQNLRTLQSVRIAAAPETGSGMPGDTRA